MIQVNDNCEDISPFNLHICAAQGMVKDCKNIIITGININESDDLGWTPIMCAARNGHKNTVMLLYEHGADLNTSNQYGYTPLSLAIASKNEETFRYILDNMYTKSSDLKEDSQSFGLACFMGQTLFVKLFLLLNIFHINQVVLLYGMTPLLLAASNGAVEVAKVLLETGANKNATNLQSQTAYDIAVYRKDTKMQALLSSKACNSPLLPLTPLNNRSFFSPSLEVPNSLNWRCSNINMGYSPSHNLKPRNLFNSNQKCFNDSNDNKHEQDHSYCQCHYLNGLISPQVFRQNKFYSSRKLNFESKLKNIKNKSKLYQNNKDKTCLPRLIKNFFFSHQMSVETKENVSNENMVNNENIRMNENLRITELLTMLKLEEYISLFIMQEITGKMNEILI
ncbi:uncharacterized protein LOC142319196 isoform X2 [Lycorma delicatula]|uniref:uncharacterized protein LOC142319196 isoform X2 n=1 Tax=Lycorma delicatula TaxID=130591 RepID=UPI003F510EE8